MSEIEDFVKPVFAEIAINYSGLDIALDTKGAYWLIEINSSPNYDIFVRDNDRQIAVKMFKDILENWKCRETGFFTDIHGSNPIFS